MRRVVWLGVLAACAGHADPRDADFPTCSARQLNITGTLGRTIYIYGGSSTSYAFVNALGGQPGHLDVELGTGKGLHLEWPTLVANGGSGDARGSIVTGSGASDLDFANCASDGYPGTVYVDADGNGGRFVLRDLHPGTGCAAAVVDGQLYGCFRSN